MSTFSIERVEELLAQNRDMEQSVHTKLVIDLCLTALFAWGVRRSEMGAPHVATAAADVPPDSALPASLPPRLHAESAAQGATDNASRQNDATPISGDGIADKRGERGQPGDSAGCEVEADDGKPRQCAYRIVKGDAAWCMMVGDVWHPIPRPGDIIIDGLTCIGYSDSADCAPTLVSIYPIGRKSADVMMRYAIFAEVKESEVTT